MRQLTPSNHYFRLLRYWRERVLQFLVQLGGISVLLLLLTMFVYMVSVTLPLLKAVEVNSVRQIELADKASAVWFSAQTSTLYWISESGQVTTEHGTSSVHSSLIDAKQITVGSNWLFRLSNQGELAFHSLTELEDLSIIEPEQQRPFSNQRIVWFAIDDSEQLQVLAQNAQGQLSLYEHQQQRLHSLNFSLDKHPQQVLLAAASRKLFVRYHDKLELLSFDEFWRLRKRQELLSDATQSIDLLSGGNSLLVTEKNGAISQWFEVLGEHGREFVRAIQYQHPIATQKLIIEPLRNVFYALSNKRLAAFYGSDSHFHYLSEALFKHADLASVNHTGTSIVVLDKQTLNVFKVDNPYPEINWRSLWHKVWYENYEQPDFYWQSTTASDAQQPKYSLVPLLFGTVKAAILGILFAAPLALSAAVYSGYFASSNTRRYIRPGIEIMEALPTVVIGLVAAVWLTPFLANYWAHGLILLLVIPFLLMLSAYFEFKFKHRFPSVIRNIPKVTWLLPILLLSLLIASLLGPWLLQINETAASESVLFNGQQGNSIVVAVALGFAVIPTLFSIAEDAVYNVPRKFVTGSFALGANRWYTFKNVVLRLALPGMIAALMMGFGRAVGETMIVLMATGNTPIMDWDLLQGMRTISATISMEMPEAAQTDSRFKVIFLTALLLFLMTSAFNTVAELLRQFMRKRFASF